MINSSKVLFVAVLMSVLMLYSAVAFADSVGDPGKIRRLTLNSSASDDFGSFHGSIVLDTLLGKVVYYWGGAYCPGLKFNTVENSPLFDALLEFSNTNTTFRPNYKIGQGNNLCLVGFTVL